MAKALLILSGGRAMPNMLTVIHEKPDLIVALVSQDEVDKLWQLRSSIDALFHNEDRKPVLNVSYIVDAFSFNDVQEKCRKAVKDHPGYDWTFNITAATKIMGFGAYEIAKELADQSQPIRCWYIDTSHANVIPLMGEKCDDSLFDIRIDQYAAIYSCRLSPGTLEDQEYCQYCQDHWMSFPRFLVQNPSKIDALKYLLDRIKYQKREDKKSKGIDNKVYHIPVTKELYTFLEEAYKADLLGSLQQNDDIADIKLSPIQFKFLNGSWLEMYIWNEACKLNIFPDCRWSQKVIDENKSNDNDNKNELDVSMIYKSRLIIVECKTGGEKDVDVIHKLQSVVSPLGGNFVSKILITSQLLLSQALRDKAKERGIVLVAREDFIRVGEIIRELAENPKNMR